MVLPLKRSGIYNLSFLLLARPLTKARGYARGGGWVRFKYYL